MHVQLHFHVQTRVAQRMFQYTNSTQPCYVSLYFCFLQFLQANYKAKYHNVLKKMHFGQYACSIQCYFNVSTAVTGLYKIKFCDSTVIARRRSLSK